MHHHLLFATVKIGVVYLVSMLSFPRREVSDIQQIGDAGDAPRDAGYTEVS
jgi:hypothetical protein